MPKFAKILLIVICVLLVAAGGGAFYLFGYHFPYENAESTMPENAELTLYQQQDGSVLLTWPAGDGADRYLVEILRAQNDPENPYEVLYSTFVLGDTSHVLQALPHDETVTVRIQSAAPYSYPFEEEDRLRFGEQAVSITGLFQIPQISNLTWEPDPDTQQVHISFTMPEHSVASLYQVSGSENKLLQTLQTGTATLQFGESFPLPAHGTPMELSMELYYTGPGYTYYGLTSAIMEVEREDLLGTVLELTTTDLGNNQFAFTWNETKGNHYAFQTYDPDKELWTTVHEVPRDGERTYTTGHLDRYSDFQYRVISVGGQTLPESDWAATPDEASVSTGASVVYSTIWPIQKLDIYKDPQRTEVIGKAAEGKAFCVLDLQEGMFLIRFGPEDYGYIDSNYCMINLPEMIGGICRYDITNSYSCNYKAHGYELPEITDTVLEGYEYMQMRNGKFLVPLLYPTSLKLEKAAFAALDKGYRLKIFDAFRPYSASRYAYDTAKKYLDEVIPEKPFGNKPVPEDMPVLEEGQELTYEDLITDFGRYNLSYFMAAGMSRHNQGIALDLTMVRSGSGQELDMQTQIQDLSWYSERKRNTRDANRLSDIMTEAGFGTLATEWWHYQDNDAKDTLELDYLREGINAECWVRDDTGWRYRSATGGFFYSCTKTIDGVSYTFGEDTYVIE